MPHPIATANEDTPQHPDSTNSSTAAMTSKAHTLPLTLILAATPSLGIGIAGGLPWPQLKKEMGYFARVTKRVSKSASGEDSSSRRRINAVIMGRKTWDSIPPKFRPLKDRLNVVVSRNPETVRSLASSVASVEGPVVASSVSSALEALQSSATSERHLEIEKVFVIGGASIYDAALQLPQTTRVLLTKIMDEFECDTHFAVDLDRDETWRMRSVRELEDFIGEEIGEGIVEEQGVRFEFCLYERE